MSLVKDVMRSFLHIGVLARLTAGSGAAAFITFLHAWLLLTYCAVAEYGWFAFILVVAGILAAAQQALVLTPLLLSQTSPDVTPLQAVPAASANNTTPCLQQNVHLNVQRTGPLSWQLLAVAFLVCAAVLVLLATYLLQSMPSVTVLVDHMHPHHQQQGHSLMSVVVSLIENMLYPQHPMMFAIINTLFVMSFMLRQYWRAFAVQQLRSDLAVRSDWHFSVSALVVTVALWASAQMTPLATKIPSMLIGTTRFHEATLLNVQTLFIGLTIAQCCGLVVLKGQIQSAFHGFTTFASGRIVSMSAGSGAMRYAESAQIRQALRCWAVPALLGVLAVEASVNLHHYLLTLWHGPAVYAPFAFLLLLFRPLALLQHNMIQHERAKFVAIFRRNDGLQTQPELRFAEHSTTTDSDAHLIRQWLARLQRQTVRAWLANIGLMIAVFAILHFAQPAFLPKLWGPLAQQLPALWCLIIGCILLCLGRAWRAPYSALLQARGDILWLSRCSSWQAICAVPLCSVFLWYLPYIWILVPMLLLELWLIWQLHHRCHGVIMAMTEEYSMDNPRH